MEVVGLVEEGLGNSAWLVDLGDGSGLVVDPCRDPRPYLREAQRRGLEVRLVAETHLHADFVSGGLELVRAVPAATLVAPRDARLAFAHQPVGDGAEIDAGGLTIRVLATPGHTPEHVAYLVQDRNRPLALFSGGTLIVGGVARTDLLSPGQTPRLARAAWRSITERLLTLPDDLPVHPTHGGGSFCSTGSGTDRVTTIGAERQSNPLLQATDEEEFVARLLGGLGSFPPYFLRLREINRRGARLYGTETPRLPSLSVADVERARAGGGQVIDVRPIHDYAAGHIPGSLSIALRDEFATWLGWLVADASTPLVFVVGDDQDRDQLVRQCLKIGYEHLAGELVGGIRTWRAAGRHISGTLLTDWPVAGRLVLDVRQRPEWAAGHIPGAVHRELGELTARAAELPDGPLVTHCLHGQRSMTAASILERAGRDAVVYLHGPRQWVEYTGQAEEATGERAQHPPMRA
jgi:hydroxyacylglutathione hydrolase